jgi:hypothetical protein
LFGKFGKFVMDSLGIVATNGLSGSESTPFKKARAGPFVDRFFFGLFTPSGNAGNASSREQPADISPSIIEYRMMPASGQPTDHTSLFMGVFVSVLIVWTCFTDKVPAEVRYQLSSTGGRLLSVAVLYAIYTFVGFIPALLFSMAIALTWSNRPLSKPVEGFLSSVKRTPVKGNLWFVERALGENPEEIREDRVVTDSVQDMSTGKNSKTSR